jgi:hypothetical protein
MLLTDVQLQAQRQDSLPSLGDIVRYRDNQDGMIYGLVVDVDAQKMWVEKIDRRGEIDKTFVIFLGAEWEIANAFKKKNESKIRTWKSEDGKFKIKASFVAVEDEKIRLKKENGKTIAVPLRKLSEKDQQYAKSKSRGDSDDPFAVEESDEIPDDMWPLIERRQTLIEDQERHQQLAKQNPNLMIGDIIKYETFPRGTAYGVVTRLDFSGVVEKVDKDGELDEDTLNGQSTWWFFDREQVPAKTRTWKSSTGKFKIEARLVEILDGDKLVLEKPNGETLKVPLSKLGKSDQNFVKKYRSRMSNSDSLQLAEERENYGEDLQRLLARRMEVLDRQAAGMVAAKDAASMKGIALNTRPLKLAAGQMTPASLKGEPFSLSLSVPAGLHARINRVCYSQESGYLAFAVTSPFDGAPTLAVTNVNSDELITNADSDVVGDDAEVLAISPSGRKILVYSKDSAFVQQLELWSHEDGSLSRISMVPYDSFRSPRAHLFSDDNGIILNNRGDLVFFDLEDRIKPTHLVAGGSFHGGNRVQISQDQKHVFYFGADGSSLHVIDVENRKCVGGALLGGNARPLSAVAQVNPDGETATYINQKQLAIFDLATGDIIAEHELPSSVSFHSGGGDSFPYLGPNLIRTFHGNIYDLSLGTEIGSIDRSSARGESFSNSTRIVGEVDMFGRDTSSGGFGGTLFGTGASRIRNNKGKVPRKVTIDYQRLDVDEIVSFAESLTSKDIIELGPGDSIELVMDLGDARVERDLESLVEEIMNEGDITIARESDFVLELKYSVGQRQTEKYRIVGGPTQTTRNVTITPKYCNAKLSYKGETIWKRGVSANLGMVWSEDELNRIIKLSKTLSPEKLLNFDYPNQLRVLSPQKKRKFSWR